MSGQGDEGLMLAGNLYIALKSDGASDGFSPHVPNVTKFELKHSGKLENRIGRRKQTRGQAVGSVANPEPTTLSIEFDSANDAEMMAMAMMGSVVDLNISASSVVDEPTKSGEIGNWVRLVNQRVGNVVIKSVDGLTTYIEDTDYEILPALGFWRPLAAGAIAAQTDLKASYDNAALVGRTINAGDKQVIKCQLLLDGENLETGDAIICEIDEAVFVSDAAIDLLANKFVSLSLTGTIRTVAGNTSPYRYQIIQPA